MMIFFVWISAVIVSLAPQFGWKDPEYMERIEQQKCMVSQDIGYQVCKIIDLKKRFQVKSFNECVLEFITLTSNTIKFH